MSAPVRRITLRDGVGGIKQGDPAEVIQAKMVAHGIYSATVIAEYTPTVSEPDGSMCKADAILVFQEVQKLADAVADDDSTKGIERRLFGQMIALDSIFNTMAIKAATCEHQKNIELYMRLALKAQSQSRCTAEAIANIKNPRQVAFVKQANIAHGHQQVNNGQETTTRTRESFSESAPNELLEDNYGNHLDTGAQGAAIGADPQLATLGKIDRRENTRGQRAVGKKRLEGRASTPDA